MTQKDAYALGNIIHQEVITFYESQFNEIFKKCNIYPQYRSFRGNISIRSKLIDQIFNDHETTIEILMKANEEEISRHFNECEKYEAQLKLASDVYSTDKMHMYQELKAKDEEIERLKAGIKQWQKKLFRSIKDKRCQILQKNF